MKLIVQSYKNTSTRSHKDGAAVLCFVPAVDVHSSGHPDDDRHPVGRSVTPGELNEVGTRAGHGVIKFDTQRRFLRSYDGTLLKKKRGPGREY